MSATSQSSVYSLSKHHDSKKKKHLKKQKAVQSQQRTPIKQPVEIIPEEMSNQDLENDVVMSAKQFKTFETSNKNPIH